MKVIRDFFVEYPEILHNLRLQKRLGRKTLVPFPEDLMK
jgi:hypothetical protein